MMLKSRKEKVKQELDNIDSFIKADEPNILKRQENEFRYFLSKYQHLFQKSKLTDDEKSQRLTLTVIKDIVNSPQRNNFFKRVYTSVVLMQRRIINKQELRAFLQFVSKKAPSRSARFPIFCPYVFALHFDLIIFMLSNSYYVPYRENPEYNDRFNADAITIFKPPEESRISLQLSDFLGYGYVYSKQGPPEGITLVCSRRKKNLSKKIPCTLPHDITQVPQNTAENYTTQQEEAIEFVPDLQFMESIDLFEEDMNQPF